MRLWNSGRSEAHPGVSGLKSKSAFPISFLARLQPNRRLFKSIVKEHLADTKENGVLVKQNNRLVRIKKVSCQLNEKVGKNGKVIEPGHSAYAYLCIDLQRSALEQPVNVK